MTTQAGARGVQPGAAPVASRPAAGKAVTKTADFKGALVQAQQPFPPASPRAERVNTASLALMAQAQEARDAGRPDARPVSFRVPQPLAPRAGAAESAFRAKVALLESGQEPGMGYAARNASSGALGRYQLMPIALRDIGWQDQGGGWTAAAARQGVSSDADFLRNPAAQEAAMGAYLERKAGQLSANGAMNAAGTVLTGLDGSRVPVTEAGLIAAAHRRGASSVARWIEHRTRTPQAPLSDAQRTAFANVERRLREFADVPYPSSARNLAGVNRRDPSSI